jgi:hypothetical protein
LKKREGRSAGVLSNMSFLPEFCHCCGVIGHIDKNYSNPVPIAERQFRKWLRVMPPKMRFSGEKGGKFSQSVSRGTGDWRRDKEIKMTENDRENRLRES